SPPWILGQRYRIRSETHIPTWHRRTTHSLHITPARGNPQVFQVGVGRQRASRGKTGATLRARGCPVSPHPLPTLPPHEGTLRAPQTTRIPLVCAHVPHDLFGAWRVGDASTRCQ